MFRDRPPSGFISINEAQRSDVPRGTSLVSVDQDPANGQRTKYCSNEDALRHLIVDLTGQNANLRVDLEMAVKEPLFGLQSFLVPFLLIAYYAGGYEI